MSEIDLIPQSFRNEQRVRGGLKIAFVFLVLLVLTIAAARVVLGQYVSKLAPTLAQLRSVELADTQQRAELEQLRAQKSRLDRDAAALTGLRGQPIILPLFASLDRSMNAGIRFADMRYEREGELVDVKPETVSTGYFIVIPKDAAKPGAPAGEQAWKLSERVEITGKASDHAMLADFLQKLGNESTVKGVKLINTGATTVGATTMVDFKLAATMDSKWSKK